MLLYNVTIIIEDAAADEWLQWMNETHIPEVMATGKFVSNRLLKVLDSPNEGVTYCIQYHASDIDKYNQFKNNHQLNFQAIHQQKFENKFVLFNTIMQALN